MLICDLHSVYNLLLPYAKCLQLVDDLSPAPALFLFTWASSDITIFISLADYFDKMPAPLSSVEFTHMLESVRHIEHTYSTSPRSIALRSRYPEINFNYNMHYNSFITTAGMIEDI